MANRYIKRVTIEGESGYVLVSEAYHETLEITPRKIIYEYEPYVNIKGNTYAKWLFETKDPAFDSVFNKIHHIAIYLPEKTHDNTYCDLGTVSLYVDDDDLIQRDYSKYPGRFNEMLDLIRSIMPFGESAWPRFLREHNEEEEEKAG